MGDSAKKNFIINTIYYLLWIAIFLITGRLLFKYILPFIIAIIVASLMQRPARMLSEKIKIKKGICAVVLSATVYITLAAFLIFIILKAFSFTGVIIKSLSNFSDAASSFFANIQGLFKGFLGNVSEEVKNAGDKIFHGILENAVIKLSSLLSNGAASVVKTAPTFLFSSIVALAATCYISRDYDNLSEFVKKMTPEKNIKAFLKVKVILKDSVLKILGGYLILMLITFLELAIGLSCLKVKNWLLLAIIISLVDALPVLGAGAFLIPWGILNIVMGNKFLGIGLMALYIILIVVRNFAESKIVGNKTGINPLFILFAMFLGLKVFGVIGLLVLPVTFIVIIKYYKNEMEEELS